VTAVVGDVPIDAATRAQIREAYGFDRPLLDQYLAFLSRVLHGDLGFSYRNDQPVLELVLRAIPSTISLMLAAMAIGITVGLVVGTFAAIRRGSLMDTTLMAFATLGLSIPSFWLGMLLLLVFAVNLQLVPAIGSDDPRSIILPAITLGVGSAATIARFLRSSLLEVLGQDYITTARSKGLSPRRVITGHALRNAFIPVLTIIGLQVGTLLAGAVVVEAIFTRRGVGSLLLAGINNRDFPVVQGTVLFATVSYVVVNLLVDVAYTVVDPRIRHGGRPA
jgi:ABC-type dipeptide/oligopeptide/nickel transport system permease component